MEVINRSAGAIFRFVRVIILLCNREKAYQPGARLMAAYAKIYDTDKVSVIT